MSDMPDKAPATEEGWKPLLPIALNPLYFLEVEEPWASQIRAPLTPEAVPRFLCTPEFASDPASLVARHRDIAVETPRLFAVPADERLLDKLVWPLRHAKAGYMLGNYLGTIALSGMVAEMVAVLFFEISQFTINSRPITDDIQRKVFGDTFEKLGQDRRVKVLAGYNIIDASTIEAFDSIRNIRKRYLHVWSQDHGSLPKDAVLAFTAALAVTVTAIGQGIDEGRSVLRPAMARYLQRKGLYQPAPDEQPGRSFTE